MLVRLISWGAGGCLTQNLVGYSFTIKVKVGSGKRPHSSSFLSRCQATTISSSSTSGVGVFFTLHGENGAVVALFKSAERWSMLKVVNHMRFWYNVTLSLTINHLTLSLYSVLINDNISLSS